MKVGRPPKGKPLAAIVSLSAKRRMNDPRIPRCDVTAQGSSGIVLFMDFLAKTEYLEQVVARHVGEAKGFADLANLTFGWLAELFAFKPGHNYYAALALKSPAGKLEIKASQGQFDTKALGLDSPKSLVSYAVRENRTVYLPQVTASDEKGEREFRYLEQTNEETTSIGQPSSETGVDIEPLIKAGLDKPCYLVAPLESNGEVLGALVLAVGAGRYFSSSPEDMVIASNFASQIAFGLNLLQAKGSSA
ncbi:MAG: hypothetical protein KKA31_03700 [Candidatus Margulisbacteria bacterium]|nr:hypothetical protein [Candidatus Margulisiibacteriota bacterium]